MSPRKDDTDDRKLIGARVATAMLARGVKPAQLARAMGVQQGQVWRVTEGKVKASTETLQRIAVALSQFGPRCTLDELAAPSLQAFPEATPEEQEQLAAMIGKDALPETMKAALTVLRLTRLAQAKPNAAAPSEPPKRPGKKR